MNKKRTELNLSNTNRSKKFIKKYTLPFILTLAAILLLGLGTVSAADWTVGPGGTYNYTSIQDAINNESTLSGDIISVYDEGGSAYTYNENVVVNKTNLTVQSTGQVTVSGSSASSPVITVNSQGAYSSIIGFKLTGATNSAGVLVAGTINVSIANLTINNCQRGVQMTGTSTNITVDGATINAPTAQGIYIDGTLTNIIIDNTTITNTQNHGIQKTSTSNLDGITITNTTITQPQGHGIILEDYVYYGTYLKNITINNVTITQATQEGIHITMDDANSANTTITNNTITHNNFHGIYLQTRGNLTLTNNTITHNGYGAGDNIFYGLHINGANNNQITLTTDNTIQENRNGIYLQNVGQETNPITLQENIKNNAGYPIWITNGHYITITNTTFDDATTQSTTGYRIQRAITLDGTNNNITITNTTINQTAQQGIYLTGTNTNITIDNTTITNTQNHGIQKTSTSNLDGITITNTTITQPQGHGIILEDYDYYDTYLKNITINNVTITQATQEGIHITMDDANSANTTITNNNLTGSTGTGVYANLRGNVLIEDNNISNNKGWGMHLLGYNNPSTTINNNRVENNINGIYIQDISGTVFDVNVFNNGGTVFQLENADNTTIENLTFNNNIRAYNYAIYASNSDNLTLKNLNITNNSAQAIWLGTSINTIINNVNITNSTQ
ncbi:right-handed parallel beta-helix repeat-containing protein, partial [Methanobacterium sp.]|uniref:right-handed parallel beta-helix repeat-containing protein n=1 Tax=Methanobacterium sp. TaxID=2164 RepID=UPI0025E44531